MESMVEEAMLRPDLAKWTQSPNDLQRMAVHAEHSRTRERCLALHRIVVEGASATQVSLDLGRHPRWGMRWVRRYNEGGPQTLEYRRTGGRRPLFRVSGSSKSTRW